MADRLRRYLARFEPAVTRFLLLGISVVGLIAQFVKPVGDALEDKTFLGGALLSLVAYVLYDTVKDLAASLRLPARSQVNSRELGRFVGDACHARTVEITFLGYTGETLFGELCHRLDELLDNPGPTRRVCIRVLVPDFGQPMTVPSRVGPNDEALDDPEFRRRHERMCQEYDQVLSVIAERLTGAGRVTVESEYRDATRAAVATWNRHLDGLWSLSTVPPWRRSTTT
ncbi:hypothetical protein [Streptomyces mirabilis]|uniref:hypothetical protein n=1 Tax=Streptomyces mirabilis TaxID=68239 RepID=UPI0036C607FC